MTFLRYVPHNRIWLYALAGWRFTHPNARSHHRAWSTLMKWNRAGDPVEPRA